MLLDAGAQLTGDFPVTPCHTAAYHKAYKALELLYEHGACMNRLDKKGLAPLHHAVNGMGPVKELLVYGASLDHVTKGVLGEGKKCGGIKKHPANSSAFHLAAQLQYTNDSQLTSITQIKSTLLYHALFYGTMNQKDALHFVWCIKKCAPLLLLPPQRSAYSLHAQPCTSHAHAHATFK